MDRQMMMADRILDLVSQMPGCFLEEVVLACPDLSWNQVFLEVDRLSREGRVCLTPKGTGLYALRPGKEAGCRVHA